MKAANLPSQTVPALDPVLADNYGYIDYVFIGMSAPAKISTRRESIPFLTIFRANHSQREKLPQQKQATMNIYLPKKSILLCTVLALTPTTSLFGFVSGNRLRGAELSSYASSWKRMLKPKAICQDTAGKFKVKGMKYKKNCAWAGTKNKYCKKKVVDSAGAVLGSVKEHCPVSCNTCTETLSPTASPTPSPTIASTIQQQTDPPSHSPTESPGGCEDTEGTFKVKGTKGDKNCAWAGKRKGHCKKKLKNQPGGFVKKLCPVTCSDCPTTQSPTESPTTESTINQQTDPPTVSPTSPPTSSPTSSPTESPTESPVGCQDANGKFKVKGQKFKKNCAWAADKKKRCKKKLADGSGLVQKVCPVACNKCPKTPSPTPSPTESPTPEATIQQQTDPPTQEPSHAPSTSSFPSPAPSESPSESYSPTISPTQSPTESPSSSSYPSEAPSDEPTDSVEPTASV